MEPSIFLDEVNERQGVFHRRAFLLAGFAGVGLLAMTGRLMELQLLQSNRYQLLSASNQFNFRIRPPPRGRILDRNGVEIASNRPDFRLMILRDEAKDIDATLDGVGQLVPLSEDRRRQLRREIAGSPRFVPVAIANDLTWDEFSRINVRAPELPGITAEMGEARVYPYGGAFAHVIGYVSKINKADLEQEGPNPGALLLHPGFRIGKQGVERALDKDLRGEAGAKKVEVDSVGRVIREDPEGDIPSVPGKEVVLSLDADVQNRALEVFGEESGAAVVMDVRTGDLLCLASAPAFDPNRFVTGISGPEYRALANYERRPLLDKALTGLYPPGSTFKTMTALAALEAGMSPDETISCGGGLYFGGRVFRCWKRGGHGPQNMIDAIKNSCDVYFYQAALRAGPDRIAAAAHAFGFGQTFEIGIGGQKAGIVPSTQWKREYYRRTPANQKWFPGESLSYGIGQGALQVNALQLAVMTARIANGRKALNPRLIRSVGGEERPPGSAVPDLPFSREHLDIIRAGMQAVTADGGTAYRNSQLGLGPQMIMAGKTGTAQVRSYDGVANRSSAGIAWRLKDHGLFVAFAPHDEPRYAISVIVQHGEGGSTAAAPRARDIMRVALLKDPELRSRIETPLGYQPPTEYEVQAAGAEAPDDSFDTRTLTGAAPAAPASGGPAPPPSTQGPPQ
jgi:penicillin-binding protein 2